MSPNAKRERDRRFMKQIRRRGKTRRADRKAAVRAFRKQYGLSLEAQLQAAGLI